MLRKIATLLKPRRSRFELHHSTLSTDLYENGELFGTIRQSGGWYTGTYFAIDGQHTIDVHATFTEALNAMNTLPAAPTPEEWRDYRVRVLTAHGYYDTEK